MISPSLLNFRSAWWCSPLRCCEMRKEPFRWLNRAMLDQPGVNAVGVTSTRGVCLSRVDRNSFATSAAPHPRVSFFRPFAAAAADHRFLLQLHPSTSATSTCLSDEWISTSDQSFDSARSTSSSARSTGSRRTRQRREHRLENHRLYTTSSPSTSAGLACAVDSSRRSSRDSASCSIRRTRVRQKDDRWDYQQARRLPS